MGKKSLILKIVGITFITLLVLTTGTLVYSILLYNGIENFFRIMGSVAIALLVNIIVGTSIISIKKQKIVLFIITNIISLLLTSGFGVGSYLLYSAYSKIDNFNKEIITHETALISKDKSYKIKNLEKTKIGIVSETDNIEGYILPQELIEKHKLKEKNEVVEYSDTLALMNALYDEEIDLAFISSNYVKLFATLEGYEKIGEETFIIEKFGKDYKKEEVEEEESTTSAGLTKPISILLMGVDSEKDGLNANASFNGDTIMLITFDPKTLNATMFSIPRDTYVTMACGGNFTKINHAAWGGTNCMKKTVEKLTGITIDYYVKINFKGVVDLVDAVGGITVDVPVPDYPKEYCLEDSDRVYKNVCLTPGVQKLDGEHALALARVRKAFALGDFQRGQNQQLVVEALMQELKNIRSINKFYEILDAVSRNIDTNIKTEEMLSFYEIGKSLLFSNENNVVNIQKTWLRGYSLYVYDSSLKNYSYTFQYYKGSLNDIVNAMKVNLGQKTKTPVKKLTFSINDLYEKTIIGDKSYSESKLALVPNFTNGYSVDSAKSWGTNNNVTIAIEEVTEGDMFNEAYPTGKIVSQSVHEGTMVMKVTEITLYVIKNDGTSDDIDTDEPEAESGVESGNENTTPGTPEETPTETPEETPKVEPDEPGDNTEETE